MKCPDEGVLLSYLEKQLGAAEMLAVEYHLASCRICQRRLQVLQDDLNFCRLEMEPWLQQEAEASVSGQYQVWEHIDRQRNQYKGVEIIMKLKKLTVAAVVVLTMVGLLSIPSVRAVADNMLQIFRVNQVSTVTLTPEDITHLQAALTQGNSEIDLEKFGQIKTLGDPETRKAVSADQLPFQVKLPAGQPAAPKFYVEDWPDAELSLNVDNVNELLKQLGSKDKLPSALAGKTFRLVLPEMVTADYGDFCLMQGNSPEIQAPSGIDINEIRQAVINLPIWTPAVRTQLMAIQDWQHTIVIPDDGSNRVKEVKVGGNNGVYIAGSSAGGQLMWQDSGRLMVLEVKTGGAEKAVQLAESLR